MSRIGENLAAIQARIAEAAHGCGRPPDSITLVAVTKYVGLESTRRLAQAGCLDLAESRPQQLWAKAEQLQEVAVRWHLVGHLQRNKAVRTLRYSPLIHSADSWRLLETLDQAAANQQMTARVLLEVNISGEAAKHGFSPQQLSALPSHLPNLRHIRVEGLMGMSGLTAGPDQARQQYASLRQLRDQLRPHCPPEVTLETLSMGMSRDFEIAIHQGATMVRIGTALFEGVDQ